jgi:hypothetical protein
VANPIGSDNFSAQQAAKQRKFDGTGGQRQSAGAAAAPGAAERAAVHRGQQRLSQETATAASGVTTGAEARQRLAALHDQIGVQPRAMLNAHAAVNHTLFEAAMVRPRV